MTEALQQAAQAVLDRWDSPQWEWRQHGPTADLMADLRAALAQPPAPTAQPDPSIDVRTILLDIVPGDDGMGLEIYAKSVADVERKFSEMGDRIEELESKRAAQPVQQPEPEVDGWPLYSGLPPAQRQPLSDEEIEAIWKAHVLPGFGERQKFYSPVVYARAIEAAHNITAAPAAQKGEKL